MFVTIALEYLPYDGKAVLVCYNVIDSFAIHNANI